MKGKTIVKIVVALVIFGVIALIGAEMFGAAAAVGIGGVVALIGFQIAKHARGGGGSGG